MARKYFLILISLFTFQANAAWLAMDEDRGFYYDPESIQTSGQRARVWGLHSYPESLPLGSEFTLSKKLLIDSDCLRGQFRTVSYAFYSDEMGEGDAIMGYPLTSSSPFGKWRSPEPNSFEQALFNQVCRKPSEAPAPQVKPNEPVEIIDETGTRNSSV